LVVLNIILLKEGTSAPVHSALPSERKQGRPENLRNQSKSISNVEVTLAQRSIPEPIIAQRSIPEPRLAERVVAKPRLAQRSIPEPRLAYRVVAKPRLAQRSIPEPALAQSSSS
jgi:hypothetical protein